ncbi:MAG: hypothetical protein PUP93_30610 [Rhizonema sp. NSF051]|nr:hypothetical protein [Rhizonema sp. NSF051]
MAQSRQRRNQLQRDCDRAQLVADYRNGETLKQIAKRLGVSESQTSRDLKKAKLNWRMRCDQAIDEQFDEQKSKLQQQQRDVWRQWHQKNQRQYLDKAFALMLQETKLIAHRELAKTTSLEDALRTVRGAGWRAFAPNQMETAIAIEILLDLGVIRGKDIWLILEAIKASQRAFKLEIMKIFVTEDTINQ